MPQHTNKLSQFWRELKRRRVIKVIAMYAATAFIIMEAGEIMLPRLGLPDWTVTFIIILLIVGFPITIILSWIFDITPEGLKKTEPIKLAKEKETAAKPVKRRLRASDVIIAVLVVIVLILVYPKIFEKEKIIELEKSIAVLPFENMSDDSEFAHLGDAMTDEIIMQLYKIHEFEVRSRTSIMQYKDTEKGSPIIGEELNVNYLLEGSTQRYEDQVRIRIQLIHASTDDHIWGDIFEGEWKDIFDIQINVAKQVARELKTVLSPEEVKQIEKEPTDNPEAYEYYLRGNDYYWRGFGKQDFSIAIKMYQKAIESDPDYALAYTQLAMSHLFQYQFHHDRSEDRLMKSKQAIDAAFKIEPELTEVYIALGRYYYVLSDYSKALKQYEIALNQSPKNSECSFWIAAIHRRLGNWEKAKEYFKKAFELDPKNSRYAHQTGYTYELLRDYAQALYYYDIVIMLRPDWVMPYNNKCYTYLKWNMDTLKARSILEDANKIIPSAMEYWVLKHKLILLELFYGNYQEALKYLPMVKSEVVDGQFSLVPWYQYYALIYGLMDNPELKYANYDSSRLMLEDKLIGAPDDSRLYSSLGIAYAGLGRKNEAIEAGEKAVELLPISQDAIIGTYRLEDLARIYVMVGEHEKALEQIEMLLSIPSDLTTNLLQFDPAWKPLENNPKFIELLETYSQN